MVIHHKTIGEGYPVVIVHGWTLDHQAMLYSMEPVFEKRNGWKRIYIDLPGMGRSQPQSSIHNSDDMLVAVLRFLDELIPNEHFAICGYSYGALIARGVARFRRDLVRGLLLFAPVIVAEPAERLLPGRRILRKDPALMSRLSPEDAAEFELMAVLQGEQEWERFREEIMIPSQNASHEFLERIRQNGYGFTFDVEVGLPPFAYPALIIAGRQDAVVGFQNAWCLIDRYPRATFAVLDMAGHNLQIERSAVFEALITDWLDRLSQSPQ